MLHCGKCGSVVPEETTVCPKCGYPVNTQESASAEESRDAEKKYSATPPGYGHHVKLWFPVVLAVLASAALYIGLRLKSDPGGIEIVKRHFVFYDDYSHGAWTRKPCKAAGHDTCFDVTYTVPVQACGPVVFSWQVYPGEDDLMYEGAQPRVDETKYAFYAFLIKDSGTLVPAQALGKPVPGTCQLRF